MKAVILAGGLGTRLSEETITKPKPMVEIGGYPIIWHLIKYYSYFDINDFIICCGYKGFIIKEYFLNYFNRINDFTVDLGNNSIEIHKKKNENWKITLINTGANTMTGGRLARVAEYLDNESFCFTYGDGLSNVNIQNLIDFHKSEGRLATLTAVQPEGRFGSLTFERGRVFSFQEKPKGDNNWINGGFFVLEPEFLNFIGKKNVMLERSPLKRAVKSKNLAAYKHTGFWFAMDTLRDKKVLDNLIKNKKAPWLK